MLTETRRLLAPDETARLIDFARACKAAARAVLLYPDGHPAIATTLSRIVQLTSPVTMSAPLRLAVRDDVLTVHDQMPARSDTALSEIATLLHHHLIAELTVHPGGDLDAWRRFLRLLGRSPEDIRAEGGISRLWTTMAGRHVEIREIDYAEILRERAGAPVAGWSDVIAGCLRGQGTALEEHARRLLIEAGSDVDQLAPLVAALTLEATAAGGGTRAGAAAVVRLLDQIIRAVSETTPEETGAVLDNLATTLATLPPDLLAALLADAPMPTDTPDVVQTVARHMTEGTVVAFVARHALAPGTPIERLATAFQTLVPEDHRARVLSLARQEASLREPAAGFDRLWEDIAARLMTSYDDEGFVSVEYGRELSSANANALDVAHVSDDPPERVATWLASVSASEIRRLDLALVTDLLRIERDPERWATLMRPVVALIEDLLLVGDVEPADELVTSLVGQQLSGGLHRHTASTAIEALIAGSLLHHIASHLTTADDTTFERIKSMCLSLGDALVGPLAEALTEESAPRARERLSAILMAFGPSGRSEVERLKASPNPAVRRTAVYLLREFGGHGALPDLTELLSDHEPQVQREAVRAILRIGTDTAYRVLSAALTTGSPAQREAILTSIAGARDERVVPALAYILDHVDHRGPLRELCLRAIQTLGNLRNTEGVDALARALRRGEWWAPRRTAVLRDAAAAALARIGTREAVLALEIALAEGSRGVRRAARHHLPGGGAPRREEA